MDDRVSDLARARVPGRNRGAGRSVVSAEVVRFIPRPRSGSEATDFPTIAFRSVAAVDDHLDTAPCEYVVPHDEF